MGRYVDELKAATLESLHPTEAIPMAVQMELPSTILPHSALSPPPRPLQSGQNCIRLGG